MSPRAIPVETGKTYGMLTVIELLAERASDRSQMVRCLCQCGNETIKRLRDVVKGAGRSCGCLNRQVHSQRAATLLREIKTKYRPGMRVGFLTIINMNRKTRQALVSCESCGQSREISFRASVTHCGCRKYQERKRKRYDFEGELLSVDELVARARSLGNEMTHSRLSGRLHAGWSVSDAVRLPRHQRRGWRSAE